MTALPPTAVVPAADAFAPIAARLDVLAGRFRAAAVLGGLGRFLAAGLPMVVGTLFVIGYFTLPPWVNVMLAVAAAGVVVLSYVRWLHRPLFHRPTFAEVARLIEQHAGDAKLPLSNELINAVLLASDQQSARAGSWVPHVLAEIDRTLGQYDLAATVPWRRQRRPWVGATVAVVAVVLTVALAPSGTFSRAFALLGNPSGFVPRTGAVTIVSVSPGNDTVLAGQRVNFVVAAETPEGKVVPAHVDVTFASGKTSRLPMTVFDAANTRYRHVLANAAESMEYVVTVGDSQSQRYRVDVLPQMHLLAYRLEVTPPAYTGRPAAVTTVAGQDLTADRGSLEAPLGSTVAVSVALDVPAREALLEFPEGPPRVMSRDPDGKRFSATLTLTENMAFAVRINDGANRTLKRLPEDAADAVAGGSLGYFALTATPDPAPAVQVSVPGRDVDAKPGESVQLAATASDEFYGLSELRLEMARGAGGSGDEAFAVVKRWPIMPGADGKPVRAYTVRHTLELPAAEYRLGDIVRYRFVATDNRALGRINSDLGPQSTPGQVFTISLNDAALIAKRSSEAWEQLRKELTALLEMQVKLRAEANGITLVPLKLSPTTTAPAAKDLAAAQGVAKRVGAGQAALRERMEKLGREFAFEPSMGLVKKSLEVLVVEDATAAVDRAGDIALLSDGKALGPMATRLRQHQSRIIDVLQSLLAISMTEKSQVDAVASKEGGDLPMDATKAWEKLKDDLAEFKKEQKQVIDATADLAKKPKDQFTKEDEKKLEQLAAVEDKWEKFLAQRLVDMSKIAEQDQANISLLEELIQMKIELAMSKNALNEKQLEIATPLEENGLESAEELTTHIERWLQHKPDRQQWQMEEPVAQNDQAMAELPKQLQDMVSELMDQEEDVTEAMEDMGSKWADSLDKGAGWDAMDGPISNMSAQGVTGNQLPNDNEIQGRSGEGREGRASGEMVGAEAVGKDGRRTPTRMTPEPFSSGKVEDKSTTPAGGATGGGKKGGMGGEGLEGPAPMDDSPKDAMQRLQGRQAQIRNEAERLQLQMQAQGFTNFKLLEAAVLMQKAEGSLKKYDYHNALYYQKQAVQSLNTAKVLSAGQMHVTLDTSPQASEKTQKEIQDALDGVMPKGYADGVKAYFEQLAKPGGN